MPENIMLKEAIEAIHHGQRGRARDLLTRLLRSDQSNPDYWLWMSSVVDSQKERVYCLQTVLRLDPSNLAARQGLVLMGALEPGSDVSPVAPVRRKWEVQAEPEPQPGGLRGVWRNPLLRGTAFGLLAIVVLGLVFAGIFGLGFGRRLTVALRPTKTPGPPPTFTVTPTFIPSTRVATVTPTSTLAGPNPLWMRLAETYTPTPLYVSTPHAISEAFRAGQRAYAREDWASALKYMQQAAQVDPNAADIQYYMGEIRRFLGENEDASKAYERALAINPNFGPAYLGRARLRLALNPGADVLADLKLAIEKDPRFGEAFLERAGYLLGEEDLEAAQQDLQKAESLIPGSPLVLLYQAEIALKQGEIAEALDFARKANQADVTLLLAYRVLGQAALASRENALALEALQTYTQYAPEDALAWSLLGQAYYEMVGRRQEALVALNQALELDGELGQAYLYRGLTYLGLDQGQLAVNDFVKARRIDARSFSACVGLARALLVTGRLNEARDQLNHCLDLTEREEDQAAVYYWRAQVLETSGNPPAAVKDWQALLDLPEESVPSIWAKTAQARLAALWTPTPVTPSPTPSRTPKASSTPKATPSPTKTPAPASPTPGTSTTTSTPIRR